MRLGNTLTCRHPETRQRFEFEPFTELPDWAVKMLEGRTDLQIVPEASKPKPAASKRPATKKKTSDGDS